ncbi:hypothetical protein ACVWW6_001332 [Bradyrhizobium sp. USDA 3311]
MENLDFLREEFLSVKAALDETLRHDYGSARRSKDYFEECMHRLDFIGDKIAETAPEDAADVADLMESLSALGSRICLIERSRLGEFSWPFAAAIEEIAGKIFVRKHMSEPKPPIVHVIAEGMYYQIVNDKRASYGRRRIMIVAFPRQLKHHVLLHSLFGHELAHTAAMTPETTSDVDPAVIVRDAMALFEDGPLRDETTATEWFKRPDAPDQVKRVLSNDPNFRFRGKSLRSWRREIVCDLFGLLLFGPSFAAAHRMILEPVSGNPERLISDESTHPPFMVRRRAITQAVKSLGWNEPVCGIDVPLVREAEAEFLAYTSGDSATTWPDVLSPDQLKKVLDLLKEIFAPHAGVAYSKPNPSQLNELVDRLALCRPPIIQRIDAAGNLSTEEVTTHHCLYAGWTFWFGRAKLREARLSEYPRLPELDFLKTNKLCDHALLQQRAIAHSKGMPL